MADDELRAEAYAALVEAAQAFDPDRGVDFPVYARPRILGAIRDYRRFLFHANWKGRNAEPPVFKRLEGGKNFRFSGRVASLRMRRMPAGIYLLGNLYSVGHNHRSFPEH